MSTIFKEKETPQPEQKSEPVVMKETENVVDDKEYRGISGEPEKRDALADWESSNGNYGMEFFGIKELAKEFPYKIQYQTIDKFIKEEIKERGYDSTPKSWQDILTEIEDEIGTDKNKAHLRLERIFNYIKTLRKFREVKAKKDKFKQWKESVQNHDQ